MTWKFVDFKAIAFNLVRKLNSKFIINSTKSWTFYELTNRCTNKSCLTLQLKHELTILQSNKCNFRTYHFEMFSTDTSRTNWASSVRFNYYIDRVRLQMHCSTCVFYTIKCTFRRIQNDINNPVNDFCDFDLRLFTANPLISRCFYSRRRLK